jgi:hypothetical protein
LVCNTLNNINSYHITFKKNPSISAEVCARDRNRTDTPLPAADFESAASTNSATRANWVAILSHSP